MCRRRMRAYMHILRYCSSEGWRQVREGRGGTGGSRVLSVCQPLNQLICAGVDEGSPTGYYTRPHKAARCLDSYTFYCVWQALLSWKQVFQLLQRLHTTREREKERRKAFSVQIWKDAWTWLWWGSGPTRGKGECSPLPSVSAQVYLGII